LNLIVVVVVVVGGAVRRRRVKDWTIFNNQKRGACSRAFLR